MRKLDTPPTQSGLAAALKPAIASKQYGYEDTLAALVAEAALAVMPPNPKNFNVDNVRVVKIMGGSLAGSQVVRGMVFGRQPEGEESAQHCLVCLLNGICRHDHEGEESEGRCFHMRAGHRANGDKRNGAAQERGGDAQLHLRRGETPRKGLCRI